MGNKKGLSLVELIIVVGIILTLIGIASVSLLPRSINRNTLDTATTTLIAEIRAQQIKAMIGDTEGRSNNAPYGVHFSGNTYTLFNGSAYDAGEPSNLEMSLFEDITISDTAFPSDTIVFQEENGEVASFSDGNNTITLQDTVSGEEKVITINQLGVVTSVSN